MSKRLLELSKEKTNLRRKIEMEHNAISEKIAEKHPTINSDEHEIVLILHLLPNTIITKHRFNKRGRNR